MLVRKVDWLGQINCCPGICGSLRSSRWYFRWFLFTMHAGVNTYAARCTYDTDLRTLAPKRPYFAQDSDGYITSRNDIPLLSLVTPLPLLLHPPCPSFLATYRDTRHPSSLLSEIAGYTQLSYLPLIFLSRCHAPPYILTSPFSTVPAEYPKPSIQVSAYVTHRQRTRCRSISQKRRWRIPIPGNICSSQVIYQVSRKRLSILTR